jgi:hypothetical protein
MTFLGSQGGAEVGGDARPPVGPAGVADERHAAGVAQVAGDDFGAGLVDEEAGAVEELHQRAGERDAALGEEHQPAARGEELSHALRGIGRGGVHREGAAVDHHLLVNPGGLGGRGAGDELPVVIQHRVEEQPVEPRDVVRDEQDRAGRAQHLGVEGAEAEPEPGEQEAEEFHRLAGDCGAGR